ncbi:MAG: helix-turn-helix domain-containing protein [Pirellulaceae bacterium]|nr:helix-turn-helix domain-containing protein [Pirellulaceae bacterium]
MTIDRKSKSGSLVMTVTEVGECLGISTRTVYRLLDAGQIPKPIKLGNSTRWRRRDIESFINEGSMPAFRRAIQLRDANK